MAARALGQGRFNSFVEQVGRRLAGGKSLTRDVLGRISTAGIVEPDGPFQEIRE
jgi:hypothetical protein